ncbi:hypothetical protein FRB95_007557 [Tulasnella sp. JGI-2019a]|nr:hypothetical protein FRB95_007557 [Tulasnella sp. JGI-2019a]
MDVARKYYESPVPAEGEWQWKVVGALVDTTFADGVYDSSTERLEFRVNWATGLSLKSLDIRDLLYDGPHEEYDMSVSPWSRSFGKCKFRDYLSHRIGQFQNKSNVALRKAAMDCLSIYTSWHMDHLLWSMTPGADQTLLELGFHVNDQFEPEFIAALYEWHFIQTY